MSLPLGVAVDHADGHIFVAENGNERISEFTAWGGFVKAFGWGVRTGAAEAQVCTSQTGCQAGIQGTGSGQIAEVNGGIAVDAAGDVYVFEAAFIGEEDFRVQKFSPAGEFLLAFGGEVNKTTHADLCTKAQVEGGNVCGAGVPGTGPGQFGFTFSAGPKIAVAPDGTVLVGDIGRIQEFNPDGTHKGQITLSGSGLSGKTIQALALDAAGIPYVSLAVTGSSVSSEANVRKLSAAGLEVQSFVAKSPRAVSVDSSGDVYAVEREGSEYRVLAFNSAGTCFICKSDKFLQTGVLTLWDLANSDACGIAAEPEDDLYVPASGSGKSFLRAFGPAPDPALCPPPPVAPEIKSQFGVSASPEGAVVRAQINPHFWPDTRYYVEYGTGHCSEGGCSSTQPLPPGTLLNSKAGTPVFSNGVFLSGLVPGTTYHYRFVAESGGGGPVYGVDPDGGGPGEASFAEGLEANLTTPVVPPSPNLGCPNQAFRTGASAQLPDCRAYEMVSPIEKNNADIVPLRNINSDPAGLDQAALSGEKLTYSSFRAFGDAPSGPYTSQYIANRDPGSGWLSHGISPPRGVKILGSGFSFDTEYRFFSPDLCQSWLMHDADPVLAPGAIEAYANVYERQDCGTESYRALFAGREEEPGIKPLDFIPDLQGVSADGKVALVRVRSKLTGSAVAGQEELYAAGPGPALKAVCILPNGSPAPAGCSAGTANSLIPIRRASVSNAVSSDGSRIFWTAASLGTGTIYVRENPFGEGGECLLETSPCTVEVGTGQYWTAAANGSRAIFTTASGDLDEFDVASKAMTPIAHKVKGLAGWSKDASRLYFVSEEAIAGTTGATANKPNLYFYEDEEGIRTFRFIATLAAADLPGVLPSPISSEPYKHIAQASPSGLSLAFMSSGRPTGYDNTDASSGEADEEVYLYDATAGGGAGRLRCVSCNPSGIRPSGAQLSDGVNHNPGLWAAAQIPAGESQLYTPRALSQDGSRLFFMSYEALASADTNGRQDVYEWEAPGSGDCSEGGPGFSAAAEGCVRLISSGEGPDEAELVDSTPSGDDVFLATRASLLPQDPGLIDIYDARAGGGFPPPPPLKPSCEGEACQSPPAPPTEPTPSSSSVIGPANPTVKRKHRKPKPRRTTKKHHRSHRRQRRAQ